MNVSLTPELEKFVAEEVSAGRYRSASEAVRAAIRLLQDQTLEREAKLEALRAAVERGAGELDRGEGVEGESLIDDVLSGLRDDRTP